MSEVLDKIKSRRSIRKYKPDPVPQELLDQIIEAGLYAANGKGFQNTIIIPTKNFGMKFQKKIAKFWAQRKVQIRFMVHLRC